VVGLSFAVAAICLAPSRTAKADFADDVTAIVEQVVEDEVASTVIPNAARCFPIACDVLPASIYALQAKRYNGFTTVVRKELSDNLGFLVVLAVDGGDLSKLTLPNGNAVTLRPETVQAFNEILKLANVTINNGNKPYPGTDVSCQFAPPAADDTSTDAVTSKATAAASTPIADDRAKALKTLKKKNVAAAPTLKAADTGVEATVADQQAVATAVLQSCLKAQGDARSEAACALGLATRDAANGDTGLLPGDAQRALEAVAAEVLVEKNGTKFSDALASIQAAVTNPAAATSKDVQQLARDIIAVTNPAGVSLEQLIGTFVNMSRQAATAFAPNSPALLFLTEVDSTGYAIVNDVRRKDYGAAVEPAAAGGVPTASYCIVGQSDCKDGQSFNWNNVEGSVFVKFVP
jgi:hypothetical protein